MSIATPEFVHCWHSYGHVTEPCEECTADLLAPQECCVCNETDKARLFLCVPFDPVNLCERCSEEWAGGYAEPASVRNQPAPRSGT